MTSLKLGFKLIRRNLGGILLALIQFLFCIVLIMIMQEQYSSTKSSSNLSQRLKDSNLVYYNVNYPDERVYDSSGDRGDSAVSLIKESVYSYTFLESVKDNVSYFPEVEHVVFYGDIESVYSQLSLEGNNRTHVYIGAKIKERRVNLDHPALINPEVMRLPTGFEFFDPKWSGINMDDKILVVQPYEFLNDATDGRVFEEMLFNFVHINPKPEQVASFMKSINIQGKTSLYPIALNQGTDFIQSSKQSLLTLVYFYEVLFFVLISTYYSILRVVKGQIRTFKIHMLYGSDKMGIMIQIMTYLTITLIVPAVLSTYYLKKVFLDTVLPPFTLMAILGIAIMMILFNTIKLLKNYDLANKEYDL